MLLILVAHASSPSSPVRAPSSSALSLTSGPSILLPLNLLLLSLPIHAISFSPISFVPSTNFLANLSTQRQRAAPRLSVVTRVFTNLTIDLLSDIGLL